MNLRTRVQLGVVAMMGAIVSTTSVEAQIFQNLSPLQSEDRTVTATQGKTGTLTLNEPEVWLDAGPARPATRGIRFPSGEYVLEAEDADYLYYRAPAPIEYRVFQDGQVKDDRFMPGGIYMSKAFIALVPAGAYLSTEGTKKTLTWKLGADFLRSEGIKWARTKITGDEAGK